MSGPKVVRVVTKQERIARAQKRIDAVQDTMEQWRRLSKRCNALLAEDEKLVQKRYQNLIKMLEKEQFQDVQRQCGIEIHSLQVDMERIQEEAIAKAEHERNTRRRLQYSAEALIKTLESASRPVPLDLISIPSRALSASTTDLATMNSIINRVMTEYTLSIAEDRSMTALQKELSQKLTEGETLETLADWKSRHDKGQLEKDRRLDRILAEIETLEGKEALQQFVDRVALIAKESSANHRALLTDSLILDLIAHQQTLNEKEKALATMREVRCELHRVGSQKAKDLEAMLTKAIDAEDTTSSKILCDRGASLLKEETKNIAGASRREAILKGLSELGYEVKENMATAWVENGRIVVKKPHEKCYGVELGAVEDAERMQVQLVALEQSGSAAKDVDRETIWCSEFSNLALSLEKSGTSLEIERALPVGSRPLKQVNMATSSETRSRAANLKSKSS